MPPPDQQPPSGPLSGLVVADFSRVLAGPYATMLLADLGAEVVKVEGPAGDDTRSWVPPTRDGVGTYYLSVNRNKRSVALDLKDPADLEIAHALAGRADVLIQNFKPGGWSASVSTTTPSAQPTPRSSTARSAGSAPTAAPACRATTSWSRACPA